MTRLVTALDKPLTQRPAPTYLFPTTRFIFTVEKIFLFEIITSIMLVYAKRNINIFHSNLFFKFP